MRNAGKDVMKINISRWNAEPNMALDKRFCIRAEWVYNSVIAPSIPAFHRLSPEILFIEFSNQ